MSGASERANGPVLDASKFLHHSNHLALKAFVNGQVGIGLMKGQMTVEMTLARRAEGTHRAVEFEMGGGTQS